MSTRRFCLAVLSMGEATGYEIRNAAREGQFNVFVNASFGSIYPCLKSMKDEGLVALREENENNRPARKVYSLTEHGRRAFIDELRKSPVEDVFRSSFLLAALFAKLLGEEEIARQLDQREAYIRRLLAELEEELRTTACHAARWTMSYGVHTYKASLTYIVENRDTLLALAKTAPGLPQQLSQPQD